MPRMVAGLKLPSETTSSPTALFPRNITSRWENPRAYTGRMDRFCDSATTAETARLIHRK